MRYIKEYLETSYYMNNRNRKVITKFDVGDFVKYWDVIFKVRDYWVDHEYADTLYELENIENGKFERCWGKEVKKVFTKKDLEKIDFYKNIKNYNL